MSCAEFDQFSGTYVAELQALVGSAKYYSDCKAQYAVRALDRPVEKILDFGCGIGLLSNSLRSAFPDAVLHGYDPSAESLAQFPEDLNAVVSSNLKDLHGDYDLAVISNVLHHVPPSERQHTVLEVVRRLKKGGGMILFEHNPYNLFTRLVVSRCVFDKDAVLLNPREALSYATHSGLTQTRRDFIVFFPPALARLSSLERWLHWLPLGAQFAVMGVRS